MEFGELEDVNLRTAWSNEAQEFTPWLADNLPRLCAALGIPTLEPIDTEHRVGIFSADIVARLPQDGRVAVIENQLERSDHSHLGQLLTYLAGTEAKLVIWVASNFAEEHISAVRWLNQNSPDEVSFFAVRVRVVRIGDSQLAPVFDVVERPSEWERALYASVAREESELTRFRREFWTYYASLHPDDGVPPGFGSPNRFIPVGSTGLQVAAYLAQGEVGVYIYGRKGEPADEVAERVRPYEQALRDATGTEVAAPYFTRQRSFDTRDRTNWDAMCDYLHMGLVDYRRVLEAGAEG